MPFSVITKCTSGVITHHPAGYSTTPDGRTHSSFWHSRRHGELGIEPRARDRNRGVGVCGGLGGVYGCIDVRQRPARGRPLGEVHMCHVAYGEYKCRQKVLYVETPHDGTSCGLEAAISRICIATTHDNPARASTLPHPQLLSGVRCGGVERGTRIMLAPYFHPQVSHARPAFLQTPILSSRRAHAHTARCGSLA